MLFVSDDKSHCCAQENQNVCMFLYVFIYYVTISSTGIHVHNTLVPMWVVVFCNGLQRDPRRISNDLPM